MPMNDKKWILIGLVIFVGLFSFPLWYNIAIKAGKAAPAPEVVLTEKAKAAEKCVMSTAYMKAEHMQLLDCGATRWCAMPNANSSTRKARPLI
jgi:hypothetical protein